MKSASFGFISPVSTLHDISITLMLVLQQVIDLQELYNAQKLLTAELSEKLDKTEV